MVRACAEEGYGVFRSTILRMEPLNKRRTGRPHSGFVDVMRKGMCERERCKSQGWMEVDDPPNGSSLGMK